MEEAALMLAFICESMSEMDFFSVKKANIHVLGEMLSWNVFHLCMYVFIYLKIKYLSLV